MFRSKWERLIMPAAGVILGLFLTLRPYSATTALCSLIGWLLLFAGVGGLVNALAFQRATCVNSPFLPLSVAGVVIGLFFILSPHTLAALVGTLICVFLLVNGTSSIQAGLMRRGWGDRLWWLPLAVGILCVVLGLYALFAPAASAAMVMRLVGIMMLCSGVVNALAVLSSRD